MKKISSEEFDNIYGHGKGSSTPLFNYLLQMKPGDAFILFKSQWHVKYPPTTVINRVERRHNMKFDRKALPDRTGWAVKRVK